MVLVRVFSKVEKDSKIKIPENIKRETRIKEGLLVELKIVGPSKRRIF